MGRDLRRRLERAPTNFMNLRNLAALFCFALSAVAFGLSNN